MSAVLSAHLVHPEQIEALLPDDREQVSPDELEELVARHGRELDDTENSFTGMGTDWFEQIDEQLQAMGTTVQSMDFVYGEPPFEVPEAIDYPRVASFTSDEAARIASRLQALDLSTVDDADVATAIATMRDWFAEAARSGQMLVTFYG